MGKSSRRSLNRTKLTQNGDEYLYSYGIRNRLEKIERKVEGSLTQTLYAEYAYDENGNTVSRTIYGDEGTETVSFEYDVLNRLVKTTRGTEFTEYFYDNAGNRVIKSSSDGSLDLYLRHGTIAVAMDLEVNGDQSEEKGAINRYVLSGDLVAGRVTMTVEADGSKSSEKSFYHLDHLNSTKVVTDEAGEVVVNYTYRAFGEQLKRLDKSNNPTEDLGKYSYSGKELDEDINLYYFNARFYDATTGRFINVDPVQDGSNWYVYCSNNPLSFTDPTGLREAIGAIRPYASGYTLTVQVDQPGSGGDRDTYERDGMTPITGHVTTTITDNDSGNSTSAGFYPHYSDGSRPKDVLLGGTVSGQVVDDSNYSENKIDVSKSYNLTTEQGLAAKSFISITAENPPDYNLSNYNCTDYAIDLASSAGVDLPDTQGNWPGGSGSNPGDMGEDLRPKEEKK